MTTTKESFGPAGEILDHVENKIEDLRCFIAVYADGSSQSFTSESCRQDVAGMYWLSMMLSTVVADIINLPLTGDPETIPPDATVN